jgi:photosystem II stability/assembly factor-like uncharacterized protein
MERASPFAGFAWRAVGPRMQGGRIEAIAVAPGRTSTIYAGAGSGSLWKSINNGTTWTPIFAKESTASIGAVAVAPSNPNIVWVGTGEVLMARSSYAGTGVYKSTDAGAHWTNMGLAESHHIAQVVIHPRDPDRVWVAVIGRQYSESDERGIYRTADGGKTWQRTLFVNGRTGAIDLTLDPSNPEVLYASMWDRSRKAWGQTPNGPGSGAYKSTDGGVTWQSLGNGLPSGASIGRIGLAIARSNPKVIYALVDNYAPAPGTAGRGRGGAPTPDRIGGEVYRSDDRGASWRKVNTTPLATGWDFCLIQVAPDNEDIVYLPNNKFMVSEDAGKTYREIQGTLVHLLPHGSSVLHLDQHELWIDPADGDHMLLGNDGGLHQTYDRGKSWLHLNNIPIGEFYAVSVDMDTPYNIYGGTQDDAALYGTSAQTLKDGQGDKWSHIYLDQWGGGDSYFTYRDPTDKDVMYYEHQFGELMRKRMSTGKTDAIAPKAPRGQPAYRTNWMTPFFFSAHAPRTMYYAAERLFKSPDRGDTWTAISGDLTSAPAAQGNVPWGTITSVSESPLSAALLYTGADDGRMHVTRDGGATWTRIGAELPERWVTRIVASRHDEATVYVAMTGYRFDDFSTYLYISRDYGRTWTSLAANLPAEPVNVIGEDPTDRRILYIGTDTGVFASIDQGRTWQSLCANLPTIPVYDLVVHPRDGELVIGTHGLSVFVANVEAVRAAARTQAQAQTPQSPVASPAAVRHFPTAVNLEDTSETSANVSLGDLDGDGDLDMVLAKGRHWPLVDRVVINDGRGHFTVSDLGPIADRSYSALLSDVNGDGSLDLVISNDRPDAKLVYLNDGKAHFRKESTWGAPEWTTRNATVADLNGDGRPDVIAANRGGTSNVCLNDGNGRFDARPCAVINAQSATSIVTGDFNRDGAIDLAIPHRDGGQSLIFFNDGKAGFAKTAAFGPAVTNARAAAAGDLNGDGWLDLVVGDERTGTRVYLNDGTGALVAGVALGEKSLAPGAMKIADMNHDGYADIIVGHADAPGTVWFGTGNARDFTAVPFGDGKGAVYGLDTGDLNGDGFPDIATARSDAPNVVFFSTPPPRLPITRSPTR